MGGSGRGVHEFADHVTGRKLDWFRYVPFLGIQAELLVIDLHGLAIGRETPRVSPCGQRFQLNRGGRRLLRPFI